MPGTTKERPYDIFISCKSLDSAGKRTPDSAMAQDIYYKLTEMGYNVYFDMISNMGKPADDFSAAKAINAARAMIVVGGSADAFNDEEVASQWRSFMSGGEGKKLIPCYRALEPYKDLPYELSVQKSFDMDKPGAADELVSYVTSAIGKPGKGVIKAAEEFVQNAGSKTAAKTGGLKKKPLIIAVAAVLVVALIVTGCLLLSGGGKYKVGDTVKFGAYPQTASGESKPIEWTVLDKDEDGYYVLISNYGLDAKPYNEEFVDITWEDCTLRAWLNGEFYETAFTSGEKSKIKTTKVVNSDNFAYGTSGGNDTQDKVYLLSLDEITRYYGIAQDNYDKIHDELFCKPTEYAIANGALTYVFGGNEEYAKYDGNGWWWLRSPGDSQDDASFVRCDGLVDYGNCVDNGNLIVHPVVRVRL